MRNETEISFADFLEANGIVFEYEGGPRIRHPETTRRRSPDFYLPSSQLFVEVKGRAEMCDIRSLFQFCRSSHNYYLYMPAAWEWPVGCEDWPTGALQPETRKRFEERANAARDECLARARRRRAQTRYPKLAHEREYRKQLQLDEILLLATSPDAARHASELTRARVHRFVHQQASRLYECRALDLHKLAASELGARDLLRLARDAVRKEHGGRLEYTIVDE